MTISYYNAPSQLITRDKGKEVVQLVLAPEVLTKYTGTCVNGAVEVPFGQNTDKGLRGIVIL